MGNKGVEKGERAIRHVYDKNRKEGKRVEEQENGGEKNEENQQKEFLLKKTILKSNVM